MPLPSAVLASAVVLGRALVNDPDQAVSRTGGQLSGTPSEHLARHIGDLRIMSVDDVTGAPVPPIALLRGSGSSARACDRVAAAEHGWVVLLRCRPQTMVTGDSAVRAAAAALARVSDGVVVDTAIPRAVLPDEVAEAERAADLIALDHELGGATCVVTTRGLARFGVPELTALDVPSELAPACDALLVGATHRIIEALQKLDGTELAVLDLLLPLRLTIADIAAGYGEPPGDDPTVGRSGDVTMATSPGTGRLTVGGIPDALRQLFGEALPG